MKDDKQTSRNTEGTALPRPSSWSGCPSQRTPSLFLAFHASALWAPLLTPLIHFFTIQILQ